MLGRDRHNKIWFKTRKVRSLEELDKNRFVDLNLAENRILKVALQMTKKTQNKGSFYPSLSPSPLKERENRWGFAIRPVSTILPNQALHHSYIEPNAAFIKSELKRHGRAVALRLSSAGETLTKQIASASRVLCSLIWGSLMLGLAKLEALRFAGQKLLSQKGAQIITIIKRMHLKLKKVSVASAGYAQAAAIAVWKTSTSRIVAFKTAILAYIFRPRFKTKAVNLTADIVILEESHVVIKSFVRPLSIFRKALAPVQNACSALNYKMLFFSVKATDNLKTLILSLRSASSLSRGGEAIPYLPDFLRLLRLRQRRILAMTFLLCRKRASLLFQSSLKIFLTALAQAYDFAFRAKKTWQQTARRAIVPGLQKTAEQAVRGGLLTLALAYEISVWIGKQTKTIAILTGKWNRRKTTAFYRATGEFFAPALSRLRLFAVFLLEKDSVLWQKFKPVFAAKLQQPTTRLFLRKSVAILAILKLLGAPLAPALAETKIFTDNDVTSPVLQQIAEISGNESSNLISDVQKRVEEIFPPPQSNDSSPPPDLEAAAPPEPQVLGMPSEPQETGTDNPAGEPPSPTLLETTPTTTSSHNPLSQTTPSSSPSSTPENLPQNTSPPPTGNSCVENPSPGGQTASSTITLLPQSNGTASTTTPELTATSTLAADFSAESPPQPCQSTTENNDETNSTTESFADGIKLQTPDNSILDSQQVVKNLVEIINTNTIKVVNEVKGKALTGQNKVVSEDRGKDVMIDTGDINIFANVLNVLNTNLLSSQIVEIAENFNNLSADVLLNSPETTPGELTQNLVSQVCVTILCQSLNSFTLTNKNYGEVENNINVLGHSGQNALQNIEKRGTIRSGDVNAIVNILNIINSNLINSRWTIASINVFGDWEGDLVLPSELYFANYMSISANDSSDVSLENINKIFINVENQNLATIENNVLVDSDSGKNSLEATGTPEGKRGDIEDSKMQTGQADSEANVKNFVNTNVFNGKWYLGMVNTLGSWSGGIFSLPEEVAVGTTPTGLSFFSTNVKDNDLVFQKFEETIAQINNRSTTTIDILDENIAKITNNVDLRTYSGENSITAQNIEGGSILSGNTYALANILNFANTNLINADLHVGVVNVLGKWNGNIVFGFPDLAVTQRLVGDYPKERDRTASYEISYGNEGGSSMIGTSIEWHFDPTLQKIKSVSASTPYTQGAPGILEFSLGKLAPRSSGLIGIKTTSLADLDFGGEVQNFAHISGIGPERNKNNNEFLLLSFATSTPPETPPDNQNPGGETPPPDNSGQNPGDNNSGGGSDQNNPPPPDGGQPGSGNSDQSSQPTQTQNPPPSSGSGNNNKTGLLRIYKTNTSSGAPIKPGQSLDFTLIIDNDGIDDLFNVMVYDTLRGPDGKIIATKKFPLGRMQSMEEVEIGYSLEANNTVITGRYSNSAYAEALDFMFRVIQSKSVAVSYFTVENPYANSDKKTNPNPGQPDDKTKILDDTNKDEAQTPTTTAEDLLTPEEDEKLQDAEDLTQTEPLVLGEVKAQKTNRNPATSATQKPPAPFLNDAEKAAATLIDLPDLRKTKDETSKSFSQYSIGDKFLTIVIASAFIALGYAVANMRQKIKKRKQEL